MVIVDRESKDRTGTIIARYAQENSWIRFLQREDRGNHSYAKVGNHWRVEHVPVFHVRGAANI
jgi:hypothetical protein